MHNTDDVRRTGYARRYRTNFDKPTFNSFRYPIFKFCNYKYDDDDDDDEVMSTAVVVVPLIV